MTIEDIKNKIDFEIEECFSGNSVSIDDNISLEIYNDNESLNIEFSFEVQSGKAEDIQVVFWKRYSSGKWVKVSSFKGIAKEDVVNHIKEKFDSEFKEYCESNEDSESEYPDYYNPWEAGATIGF